MKIAMWSGPRNLSTAMMYSFAARDDFSVMDEPFYAAYLTASGADHPMRAEILASQENDPLRVADICAAPVQTPHLYMKHMPHHMMSGFPMDWADGCVHVHLIRHPARVIASYRAKRQEVTLEDIGYPQQLRVFQMLGGVVIDSSDILADPELMLRKLCDRLNLAFDPAMLSCPPVPRSADGIWAQHWYGSVHKSTGFGSETPDLPKLEPVYAPLLQAALPIYSEMAAQRI